MVVRVRRWVWGRGVRVDGDGDGDLLRVLKVGRRRVERRVERWKEGGMVGVVVRDSGKMRWAW